jgi:hypothetical protein
MAEVDEYATGTILARTRLAIHYLKLVKVPIIGSWVGGKLRHNIRKFEPVLIDMEAASELIRASERCAVGERVCRAINRDSELTESVFLDELAAGMVGSGKARYVPGEEAIQRLNKYPNNPLILSKVSGRYVEICRSLPAMCVYWRMERCGIGCLNRNR